MKLRCLLLASALAACGGRRATYPTAESPLRLERVVLYRNGIGYFERVGSASGDVLTLKVRKDQVNDLLKSLTVVERSSGRAVSVSMPLDPSTWASAALASLRPGQGNLAAVLDALRGSSVALETDDGEIRGRVVLVEALDDPPGEDGEAPARRDHRVTLLDDDEMKVVRLSRVETIELEDGDLAMHFNRTLDASAGEGMFQQVEVSIRLAGAREHDLLVSYVAAAPMWKPTYRVVLPREGKGKALLQAWAVVDNTSGEDWRGVHLGLTAGAPIAFRYDLHTPRVVERADLTESGVRRQVAAMVGESTAAPAPPPVALPAAAEPTPPAGEVSVDEAEAKAERRASASKPARSRSPRGYGALADAGGGSYGDDGVLGAEAHAAADRPAQVAPPPAVDADALRRSTLAQARARTVVGQTRFDLAGRVTVPDRSSTMVAIVNADVEGEEAFLFRPGGAGLGYETNPYRVVRFVNSTPFALESGPISIFAGGSFVGEGLSEPVGSGTSATIPFAVEPGISITASARDAREDMRLVKLSRGVLEVEQFARRETTYTARVQQPDRAHVILIRHPRAGGAYALAERPAGTEDLPDAYLVRLPVARGMADGALTVVEQTPSRTTLSIWAEPALGLLEKLMLHAELGDKERKRLEPVLERRRALARLEQQIAGLTEKRGKLDQRAAELRENLRAIARNNQAGEQRARWTRQLDEFTTEGNKLGAELAGLEARRLDRRIELEDALGELEIVAPAPRKR